jgi:phosphoglycolate phosphatase-like HAD superfamily hydrolase
VDREVWLSVSSDVSGRKVESIGDTPGRTDPQIFRDTLLIAGVEPGKIDSLVLRALDREVTALEQRTDDLVGRGYAMPGAREVLAHLSSLTGVTQAPVTGNVKANAVLKLRTFGLADHLRFECGAYGSDSEDRASLVELARTRSSEIVGTPFTEANTLLVGDSVLDVAAALRGGARPVAVATGRTSADALKAAGAVWVFDDLTQLLAVVYDVGGVLV